MRWSDAMDTLARYFRVDRGDLDVRELEIVVDQKLSMRVVCSPDDFLIFFGYFSLDITENDSLKIKNILQWNLARIVDTEDTLALESDTNHLFLFRKKPLSQLFVDNLFKEVELFVANLEFWADAFAYMESAPMDTNFTIFK